MLTFDLNALPLEEVRDPDGNLSFKYDFPAYAATGCSGSAVVYFEIEPGEALGMHTDSEEEIVLVLAGTGEGTVGEESAKLQVGQAVVIPAMVPHDFRNVGNEPLRAIGFFGGATVISTFEPIPDPEVQAVVIVHDRNGERALTASDMEPPE